MSEVSQKTDMEATREARRELEEQAKEIVANCRLAGMVVHLWLETYGYDLLQKNIQKE